MAIFADIDAQQRIKAGLLFLLVAVMTLYTQPAGEVLSAVIAGINLLISTLFLVSVGRDTTEEPGFDVGFWLLAMVSALGTYIVSALVTTGTVPLFGMLLFIIGFGIILGLLAEVRGRITQ